MMFFFGGLSMLTGIYVLAAVLPAVFLLRYIYRHDTVEKEPPGLLFSLLLLGVLSALCSIVLERLGERVLPLFVDQNSPFYAVLTAFLVVALVEEGTKLFFLKRRTWHDPNFNYRFDGIVYAVFVSLGFAAYENIRYVFSYGLSVALPRALLAVPGHLAFSIFMGLFYSRAKLSAARGHRLSARYNLVMAYLSAVFLHGFYDACAMVGTPRSMALFLVFVLLMFLLAHHLIKRESARDRPI